MNGKELLQKAHRTIENVYKTGYADGCSDKQHDLEHDYAKGLEDAWECARSVVDCKVPYDFWELSSGQSMLAVFKHYSAKGAIEKIREYEEKQKEAAEIKVGDEIRHNNRTSVILSFSNDGWATALSNSGVSSVNLKFWEKTGRHFSQVAEMLSRMQEEE